MIVGQLIEHFTGRLIAAGCNLRDFPPADGSEADESPIMVAVRAFGAELSAHASGDDRIFHDVAGAFVAAPRAVQAAMLRWIIADSGRPWDRDVAVASIIRLAAFCSTSTDDEVVALAIRTVTAIGCHQGTPEAVLVPATHARAQSSVVRRAAFEGTRSFLMLSRDPFRTDLLHAVLDLAASDEDADNREVAKRRMG